MSELAAVRVNLGPSKTDDEATELRAALADVVEGDLEVQRGQQINEGDRGILPVVPIFIWWIVGGLIGAAGIARITMWVIRKTGCSAIISRGEDGKVDIRKDCDYPGLRILEASDKSLTIVDDKLIDFDALVKVIIEKGIDAAVKMATDAGAAKPADDAAKAGGA